MSRYINTDALEVVGFTNQEGSFSDGVKWLLEYIDKLPSADVQPVIRCKDCDSAECSGVMIYCLTHGCYMRDNDFCNYSERKGGKQNG